MSPQRRVRTEEVGAPVTILMLHHEGILTSIYVVDKTSKGALDIHGACCSTQPEVPITVIILRAIARSCH
jgi:hypothetical protein